jgi:SAM-dependent methyltransferase
MAERTDANKRWGQMLAAWAIPPELIDAAPASPYFFDPAVFIAAADQALARVEDTVSDGVAREALPEGGTVLDVGAGAGAASLRLGPTHVTAVDPSSELLEAFASRAVTLGLEHAQIEGTWPDVAPRAPEVDVVVCHHVIYNVADLRTFAALLDAHGRRRVVIELTSVHPMAWMTPYWRALHGIEQPERPTAEDAVTVLGQLGLDVNQARSVRPVQMIGELGEDRLARIARRLCLPAVRLPELQRLLEEVPPSDAREVVTLWW